MGTFELAYNRFVILPLILMSAVVTACGSNNLPPIDKESISPAAESGILLQRTAIAPSPFLPTTANNEIVSVALCDAKEPKPKHQLTYNGVKPGQTTENELVTLWGNPESKTQSPLGEHWVFGDKMVILQTGIVSEVVIDVHYRLIDVFNSMGCPNIIYLIEYGEHLQGSFNGARLVYLSSGLSIDLTELPIDEHTNSDVYTYFRPVDKTTYEEENDTRGHSYMMEVTWDDFVKWKRP